MVLHGENSSPRDTAGAGSAACGRDLATRIEPRSKGGFLGGALAALPASVRNVLFDARVAAIALDDGLSQVDANADRLRTVPTGIADDLRAASASVERLERVTVEAGGEHRCR